MRRLLGGMALGVVLTLGIAWLHVIIAERAIEAAVADPDRLRQRGF